MASDGQELREAGAKPARKTSAPPEARSKEARSAEARSAEDGSVEDGSVEDLSEEGETPAEHVPKLPPDEREEAHRRSAVSALVIHEAIREEGDFELSRPASALAWSGLASGLSMGFSLVTEGLIRSHLPDAPWRPLLSKVGYTIGFLITIIGKQQLFTENTLTAVLPFLARRDMETLGKVARIWLIVLLANLFGTATFAFVVDHTPVFDPHVQAVFGEMSREAARGTFGAVLIKGVFAGWLIALMVWLLPSADSSRVAIVLIITYVVGLGGLTHIIAGSVEVFYGAWRGVITWQACCVGYLLPTLLGNIFGGVALVAVLNHQQVVSGGE